MISFTMSVDLGWWFLKGVQYSSLFCSPSPGPSIQNSLSSLLPQSVSKSKIEEVQDFVDFIV